MPKDWRNTKHTRDADRIEKTDSKSSERLARAVQGIEPEAKEASGLSTLESDGATIAASASPETRGNEALDEQRLGAAAERIKAMTWLEPEKWRDLDESEKRVALDRVGRELSEAYKHPAPPLLISENADVALQGQYKDEQYGIFMNRAGEPNREQKLLGDDPVPALRTYAHEWRHSYQFEQAMRSEKPQFKNLVDDPDPAREWSSNIAEYIQPPEKDLKRTDPEAYKLQFEAYRQQSVERDARDFSEKMVRRVYGRMGETL